MSDWPGPESAVAGLTGMAPASGVVSNVGPNSGWGHYITCSGDKNSLGQVWVTANSARYFPIYIQQPVTAYQMFTQVTAQSGNVDVGIYNEFGTRLVSSGTTAVGAVGIQVFNIADTALVPGTYYLAMACDNVVAGFNRIASGAPVARICGVQDQTSAFVLPATATMAAATINYHPFIAMATTSVI